MHVQAVWVPDIIHDIFLPLEIIQVDKETGEPLRGPDGLCIKSEVGMTCSLATCNTFYACNWTKNLKQGSRENSSVKLSGTTP